MKSFIMACVAAIVIAVIGGVVLNSIQEPVDKAYTTSGVRLGAGDPGSADQGRVG
jgi:hypothetical protein